MNDQIPKHLDDPTHVAPRLYLRGLGAVILLIPQATSRCAMKIAGLIYLLPLLFSSAAGCTKFQMLNATVSTWGYDKTLDLSYGNLPRQKLDVYRPRGAKSPAGVVVFFYGGGWQSGEKGDYRFVAEALTSRGFVAVLPDYRLYPGVLFPAFVEDGAVAIRWVHDHATEIGGDPTRVYLMGHSAGAHIAAMLTLNETYLQQVGLDRTAIRATAALSGPYDFIPRPSDRPVFAMGHDDPPPAAIEPIHFVDGHAPPMLLIQGMRDTIVDPRNAMSLAAQIKNAGGEVELVTYPDREHADVVLSLAAPFRWLAPTLSDAAGFFSKH